MIPYVSIHDARKIIENPFENDTWYSQKTDHGAKDRFHANGLSLPWIERDYRTQLPKGVRDIKSQCHLGLWIPGISLPWELVVSVSSMNMGVGTTWFNLRLSYICRYAW